jgi:hypothetical protein
MIINLGLFIILELGSGFCTTLPQFLGARSLYGIAMGGKQASLDQGSVCMIDIHHSII